MALLNEKEDTHHEETTDSHSNSSFNFRSRKLGATGNRDDGPATEPQPSILTTIN